MKQVELTGIKQFEEKEVERPKPAADQALIKVEAVGICAVRTFMPYTENIRSCPFRSCWDMKRREKSWKQEKTLPPSR